MELFFVMKHEGGGRGDAFGHRIDAEDGVFVDWLFCRAVCESELLLINDLSFAKNKDRSPGELFLLNERFDSGVNFRECF